MASTDDMHVLLVRAWFEAVPSEPSLRIRILELDPESGPGAETLAVTTSASEACGVVFDWLGQLKDHLKDDATRR
jgi:hypothetical protein